MRFCGSKDNAAAQALPRFSIKSSWFTFGRLAAFLAAAIMLLPIAAQSEPIPIDGTTYTQDFNTLASSGTGKVESLPLGWTFVESKERANAVYTAGSGTITTGDTYSFGNTGDIAEVV